MLYILVSFLVYEICSVWWFITTMGYKHRPDRWYDWVFYPGTLLVIYLILGVTHICEFFGLRWRD